MRLAFVTLWMLAGSAITGAVYWAFLITPESTIWTLAMSAMLAIAAVSLLGLTITGAIAIWSRGVTAAGLRLAAQSIGAVVPAALIVLLIWWLTNRVETWMTLRSGEISAWFIARLGWDDVSWLFAAVHYGAQWLRWVLAALLAVSLMAGVTTAGWRALAQAAWLRRALRPRTLIASTGWFLLLIALPWWYLVPWRPDGLPASSVELVFIVTKLSVAAVLVAIGAALIIHESSRVGSSSPGPASPATALAS